MLTKDEFLTGIPPIHFLTWFLELVLSSAFVGARKAASLLGRPRGFRFRSISTPAPPDRDHRSQPEHRLGLAVALV